MGERIKNILRVCIPDILLGLQAPMRTVEKDFKFFSSMTRLRHLKLYDGEMTEPMVSTLATLTNLQSLSLVEVSLVRQWKPSVCRFQFYLLLPLLKIKIGFFFSHVAFPYSFLLFLLHLLPIPVRVSISLNLPHIPLSNFSERYTGCQQKFNRRHPPKFSLENSLLSVH